MNLKSKLLLLFFLIYTPLIFSLPIFYHEQYNFNPPANIPIPSFLKLRRSEEIYHYLIQSAQVPLNEFCSPQCSVSNQDLEFVHSQEYLSQTLRDPQKMRFIMAINELGRATAQQIESDLLTPMRWITQGTIDAAFMALEQGWAINLGGGFHHAKAQSGSGFCCYSDIAIAVHKIWNTKRGLITRPYKDLRILIIDLDAHQGNGYADVLQLYAKTNPTSPWSGLLEEESKIFIFDMYNDSISFPKDEQAKEYIAYDHPVLLGIQTEEYLKLLKNSLPSAIEDAQPALIIYNAGSDILEGDPLGGMKVSEQGLIDRDAFVFGLARERNIPIVMLLSGGYTQKSIDVVGQSIENILKNVLKVVPVE